jgi:hypothetical protein
VKLHALKGGELHFTVLSYLASIKSLAAKNGGGFK